MKWAGHSTDKIVFRCVCGAWRIKATMCATCDAFVRRSA